MRPRLPRSAADAHHLMRRATDVAFTRLLRGGFAAFGTGSTLTPSMFVVGPDRIELGSRVRFDPLSVLSAHSADGESPRIFVGDDVEIGGGSRVMAFGDATLSIGNRSKVAGGTSIVAACDIRIGEGALLGWNAVILDFAHQSGHADLLIRDQGFGGYAPVSVGDGAWVGANAVILPGATIGKNAIVGANSVVTKDVPPGTTVVGMPARPVSRSPDKSEDPQDASTLQPDGTD